MMKTDDFTTEQIERLTAVKIENLTPVEHAALLCLKNAALLSRRKYVEGNGWISLSYLKRLADDEEEAGRDFMAEDIRRTARWIERLMGELNEGAVK